jgi:hypothetical protein
MQAKLPVKIRNKVKGKKGYEGDSLRLLRRGRVFEKNQLNERTK